STTLEPASALKLLSELADDSSYGFCIGSFGAIGEFRRDRDEETSVEQGTSVFKVSTARGALRIEPTRSLRAMAYDTLLSDGQGWSHALALCVERPTDWTSHIVCLGPDENAIRRSDRHSLLFDTGVAAGAIRM